MSSSTSCRSVGSAMIPSELVMLDSNIPMYAAGQDHPYRIPCRRVLERIVAGELEAVTNVEVHQEILHRYIAIGLAGKGREVSQDFQYLVPRVLPVTLEEIGLARELSAKYPELPAVSYTHLRAHETRHDLVCRLLL